MNPNKYTENDLFSDLTIIVPTYNRQKFVLRTMRFWSGSKAKVYVLDGTSDPINRNELKQFSKNIQYFHLPFPLNKRFSFVTNLIETKYTITHADDEFLTPSGVLSCIKTLENNLSLVSCMGRCILFRPLENSLKGKGYYSTFIDYSVMQDDPIERMVFHMNNYACSTVYSVLRTPVWKKSISIYSMENFTLNGYELFFEIAVCFLGKSKVIPVLSWLRSSENPEIPLEGYNFLDWWNDGIFEEEHKRLLDSTSLILNEEGKNEIKTVRDGIKMALDAYVSKCGKRRLLSLKNKILNYAALKLPRNIKNILRPLNNKLTGLQEDFKDVAIKHEKSGVQIDMHELENIERIILDFHASHNSRV